MGQINVNKLCTVHLKLSRDCHRWNLSTSIEISVRKIFENAGNRTRGSWVRSVNATSVLCCSPELLNFVWFLDAWEAMAQWMKWSLLKRAGWVWTRRSPDGFSRLYWALGGGFISGIWRDKVSPSKKRKVILSLLSLRKHGISGKRYERKKMFFLRYIFQDTSRF